MQVLRSYRVRPADRRQVRKFLDEHPYLFALLAEAVPHLRQVFGDAPVYLDLDVDPETGFEELFGIIIVPEEMENVWQVLRRFDDAWFLAQTKRTRGRLNFTINRDANRYAV